MAPFVGVLESVVELNVGLLHQLRHAEGLHLGLDYLQCRIYNYIKMYLTDNITEHRITVKIIDKG